MGIPVTVTHGNSMVNKVAFSCFLSTNAGSVCTLQQQCNKTCAMWQASFNNVKCMYNSASSHLVDPLSSCEASILRY